LGMLPSCGETRFGGPDHPKSSQSAPVIPGVLRLERLRPGDAKGVLCDQECEVEAASSTTTGDAPAKERFEIHRLSSVPTPRRKMRITMTKMPPVTTPQASVQVDRKSRSSKQKPRRQAARAASPSPRGGP